jgi:tRNA-dihydrouridine synthase 3
MHFTILNNFLPFIFSNYGLEHWGSDQQGVNTTRRFLLEWLSFLHRYVPHGLLERTQTMNQRPPLYFGRSDLETLLSSGHSEDWVRISEMLLGAVPEGFTFVAKHKSNAYASNQEIDAYTSNG